MRKNDKYPSSKKQYSHGFFAQLLIHILVLGGLYLAAYYSLTRWIWWPLAMWLLFTMLINSLLWYDTVFGWVKKR